MSDSAVAVAVHRWPAIDALDVVDAAVTTRIGGVSTGDYDSLNLGLHVGDVDENVLENRRRAAMSCGVTQDDLVFCNQTHGTNVAVVTSADRGRGATTIDDAIDNTDALITADPTVTLVIMVADCVPLIIVDPINKLLACVHAGWRGTAQHITTTVVEQLFALGAKPEYLVAGIGPHIGQDVYEVGPEVAATLQNAHPMAPPSAIRRGTSNATATNATQSDGTVHVDLGTLNAVQLHDMGVATARIHRMDVTTSHPDFFSDRAARPCGRFGVMARLSRGT